MQTQKYFRKQLEVEAVQVTHENLHDVAEWCGGDVRYEKDDQPKTAYVKVQVHRPQSEKQTKAFISDWVLKSDSGYKVYPNRSFLTTFDEGDRSQPSGNVFENEEKLQELRVIEEPTDEGLEVDKVAQASKPGLIERHEGSNLLKGD